MDIAMLGIHNAKEREKDDWIELFKEADPRFKFAGIKQLEFSRMGIVEAAWVHT